MQFRHASSHFDAQNVQTQFCLYLHILPVNALLSYISDKYLQGILIGSISEINVDSNNLTRSGYITPAVDFSKIQEVLVLTKTKEDMTSGADNESASDTAKGE